MSTLYNLEPQPTAKILLQTTGGDIELELFAKQTPLASRNFLQHCLDGYYIDTIFHRVVPGFIVQGGDPTGTGFGGQSIYDGGAPFADEFHSRLKYNRRGLLGMANSGKANDNGSQFFVTLGATPELAGKNTLFGRVVGDTIFNIVKMADVEMAEEGGDRPLYPVKITGAEILVNPFEDMVKRERGQQVRQSVQETGAKKKAKRKAGKALLSFGDDGEEDGPALPIVKKPKFNPKLVESTEPLPVEKVTSNGTKSEKKSESIPKKIHNSIDISAPKAASIPKRPIKARSASPSSSPSPPPAPVSRKDQLSKAQAEIETLKASLRRGTATPEPVKEKPQSALEAMIPETSTRAKKRGRAHASAVEEARTLAMFNSFRSKLGETEESEAKEFDPVTDEKRNGIDKAVDADDDEEAELCDLHFIANCQSCSNWTAAEGEEDDTGEGWMGHKLSFEKDRLGKDLEWKRKNEEELVVVDPLEKARELGVEKVAKGKEKRERHRDRESRREKAR
jgi:peptidyl-prolyl cis-trans isomerase SDCCAG10